MNNADSHGEARAAVASWLRGMSQSVRERDIARHLSLMSDGLAVFGMPGSAELGYAEWAQRRTLELDSSELLGIYFRGTRIVNQALRRIKFATRETLAARDGTLVVLDEQVVLECDDSSNWRAVEITIDGWHIRQLDLEVDRVDSGAGALAPELQA
jgi:hypothetical protein